MKLLIIIFLFVCVSCLLGISPQLFVLLDSSRGDTDESLTELATCAYSIDKMVGNQDSTSGHGGGSVASKGAGKVSMIEM